MRKSTLVSVQTVALMATLLAATAAWAHTTEGDAKFGTRVLLPGHINEVAIDEMRRLVYAANYSAGRVEVVSMDTNLRIGSFPTSPQPAGTSSVAISPNGQWLVATSQPVNSGVPQQSSVTIVNLNDTSDRRHIAFATHPLAVAFQYNNQAVIMTEDSLVEFNPVNGVSKLIYSFEEAAGPAVLPVPPPTLPREIVNAYLTASADGRWIFGMAFADGGSAAKFLFSYQVMNPVGLLRFRLADTLVSPPIFNQVSGAPDGSYFMAGQLLFSNDLQVMADTPEADSLAGENEFVGGTGYNFGTGKIYASFGNLTAFWDEEDGDNHPRRGILQIMDEDNLFIRERIRLTERVYGRIQSNGDGSYAYAVSESGLMYLPISDLAGLPQLEVKLEDRDLIYQFGYCTQLPITKTMLIDTSPGGAPAAFSLSTDMFSSSGRSAVNFEPHDGVTPAVIKVTVDPGLIGPVQGTTTIPVKIETNSVNVSQSANVITNVKDVDQRGTLHPTPGHLIQVLGDKFRDRFYVLDAQNFKVYVYDSKTMTKIKEFRTGNSPSWMTLSQDTRYLIVANSRAEHSSIFELNQLESFGYAYIPWRQIGGQYPYRLATDATRIMMVTHASPLGGGFLSSRLMWLSLPARTLFIPETLGIYENKFRGELAMAPSQNGDYILIAETPGREGSNVHLYETSSRRIILSRWLPAGNVLEGSLGAGTDFYTVGNYLFNPSIVPLSTYEDETANYESSGFTFAPDGSGIRSIRPTSAVDSGVLQRINPKSAKLVAGSTRMTDPPPARIPQTRFSSTLTTLRDGRVISTSSAGIVELPAAFDSGLGNPRIEAITSGADFSPNVATGGLISIFGDRFAAQGAQASGTPLPYLLNEACVSVNGQVLPLLYVGPNQINAQMQYGIGGNTAVQVHTADGISDIFVKQVSATAPAIFGVVGPNNTRYPAIFREDNSLATLSNPIRTNESFVIYLTGLGDVNPFAVAGNPASSDLLQETVVTPSVTIAGAPADVTYSGLTPGYAGLYQINATAAGYTPAGTQQPLVITIGGASTTVNVRVVQD